ncbi:hypothetical protein VYU27_006971, partial [Nannochloropsis oceanica]
SQDLDIGEFDKVHPRLVEATANDAAFRKNAHPNISADVKKDVRERLSRYFTEFGYEKEYGQTL